MARRKITKKQAEKVAIMREYLGHELGQEVSIPIDTEATHITCIKGTFQNVTGFYIMGEDATGDKMKFSEIHTVYTAALKDKDFSAFVATRAALKQASTSSKAPGKDEGAANGQETAQDGDK